MHGDSLRDFKAFQGESMISRRFRRPQLKCILKFYGVLRRFQDVSWGFKVVSSCNKVFQEIS